MSGPEQGLERTQIMGTTGPLLPSLLKINGQGKVGLLFLAIGLFMACFGPWVAPYDPQESLLDEQGRLKSLQAPSRTHPLGTTWQGRDVLSQVLCAARPTITVGVAAALIIAFLGVNVGMVSGYFGKTVDLLLMRIVDILYGLPFLPLMIVLLSVLGRSRSGIILCIGLIAWRDVSRIIRAQVLTIKELPYVQSARVMGAGHFRVIYVHIFPNVLPSVVLFLSFAMVWSILAHADISFLGFGDPATLTWGSMIYSAWSVGVVTSAFWWYLPPAICIAMVSSGAFFFARAFEEIANPRLKER